MPLIGLVSDDVRGWAAAVIERVAQRHHRIAFRLAKAIARIGASGFGASISAHDTGRLPAMVSAHAHTE